MNTPIIAMTTTLLSLGRTPNLSPIPTEKWETLITDSEHQSYAFLLRHCQNSNNENENENNNAANNNNNYMTNDQLNKWFHDLHPSSYTNNNDTPNQHDAWTSSSYQGETLLRKTAWCILQQENHNIINKNKKCICEYGYSDTWQPICQNSKMNQVIQEITTKITSMTGLQQDELNCVNLNYYPRGGGVGFHADDEFLFDGLRREIRIISLSLCGGRPGTYNPMEMTTTAVDEKGKDNDRVIDTKKEGSDRSNWGVRKFQIRPKTSTDIQEEKEVLLGHGDIMTMEGMFQKYYLHSVWPGDSKEFVDHPLCQGERINLTWRTIVRHLDGSEEECRGIRCPLANTAD